MAEVKLGRGGGAAEDRVEEVWHNENLIKTESTCLQGEKIHFWSPLWSASQSPLQSPPQTPACMS